MQCTVEMAVGHVFFKETIAAVLTSQNMFLFYSQSTVVVMATDTIKADVLM